MYKRKIVFTYVYIKPAKISICKENGVNTSKHVNF